jgi:EF-P beta-lysylation protein EpmB
MQQIITRNADHLQGNWQKELAKVITDPMVLLNQLNLNPADFEGAIKARQLFAMRVPAFFAALMEPGNPNDPLLLQVLPSGEEFIQTAGFSCDPLDEQDSPVPGLLHKYKSRVLLIVRGGCAVNCRYCFRRHFPYQDNQKGAQGWQPALDYITEQSDVNEVIFSGGDPLMARDDHLADLIEQLGRIPHLKRVRIHSRLPVVLPSRLTPELTQILARAPFQVILVTHINHPNEVTPELTQGLAHLRQAGIWLLNQSVLLKKVNDNAQTLAILSESLFDAGIQPYYLHLLDRVEGGAHFEVPQSEAIRIMAQLHQELPGFLVPKLVREQAGKTSKTPIDLAL